VTVAVMPSSSEKESCLNCLHWDRPGNIRDCGYGYCTEITLSVPRLCALEEKAILFDDDDQEGRDQNVWLRTRGDFSCSLWHPIGG